MPVRKKSRSTYISEPPEELKKDDPGSVMTQFKDEQGNNTGAQVLIPISATVEQLGELLATIVPEDQRDVPFAFYLDDTQISKSLADVVHNKQKDEWMEKQIKEGRRVKPGEVDKIPLTVPEEVVLSITFRPQAVFRVRPVSRCAATLDGHSEAVLIVAFSPDGKVLATGGGDKEIRLWDILTSTPTDTLTGHKHWVQVLAWSPDGSYLVSGSREGALLVWSHGAEYTNFKSKPMRGHTDYVTQVSWEPQHINAACNRFVSASKDSSLKVWHTELGLQYSLHGHTACATCVKWGGDNMIYSSSQDKTLIVWDAKTGSPINKLAGHAHWVNFIALSTDLVLRTGVFDHEERTFASKEEQQLYAKERYDSVIARGGGVERLVSCSDDNTMFLWTPTVSTKPVARMTGHQGAVYHIAFSPDGSLIASCGADKSVKLWNALDGKFITTFRGHVAAVYHVSWSLDSRLLVSGSRDTTLKLWSVSTRQLVEDMSGHNDEIFSTDWSPDGQRVATGSKDKRVKIWVH